MVSRRRYSGPRAAAGPIGRLYQDRGGTEPTAYSYIDDFGMAWEDTEVRRDRFQAKQWRRIELVKPDFRQLLNAPIADRLGVTCVLCDWREGMQLHPVFSQHQPSASAAAAVDSGHSRVHCVAVTDGCRWRD